MKVLILFLFSNLLFAQLRPLSPGQDKGMEVRSRLGNPSILEQPVREVFINSTGDKTIIVAANSSGEVLSFKGKIYTPQPYEYFFTSGRKSLFDLTLLDISYNKEVTLRESVTGHAELISREMDLGESERKITVVNRRGTNFSTLEVSDHRGVVDTYTPAPLEKLKQLNSAHLNGLLKASWFSSFHSKHILMEAQLPFTEATASSAILKDYASHSKEVYIHSQQGYRVFQLPSNEFILFNESSLLSIANDNERTLKILVNDGLSEAHSVKELELVDVELRSSNSLTSITGKLGDTQININLRPDGSKLKSNLVIDSPIVNEYQTNRDKAGFQTSSRKRYFLNNLTEVQYKNLADHMADRARNPHRHSRKPVSSESLRKTRVKKMRKR